MSDKEINACSAESEVDVNEAQKSMASHVQNETQPPNGNPSHGGAAASVGPFVTVSGRSYAAMPRCW